MKKIKQNWFKFLSKFMPNEANLCENKHQIINLLMFSNYQKLSVKEQIELFKRVESEFYNRLSKQNLEAEIILADIEDFLKTKNK
jgi:hypothetical protein